MNRDAQLSALKGQVGYHEGPSNSNKFGPWQGISNAAWCDSFAQWGAVANGGFAWQPGCQFGTKGDAYCPYTERHAQELGLWRDRNATPQPGWQVTYDWGGDSVADHIGTVVGVNSDGTFVTIEGNYQDSVQYVKRDRRYVRGFVALPADGSTPAPPPPPTAPSGPRDITLTTPYMQGDDVRGWQHDINAVQHAGLTEDGVYGPASTRATRDFQAGHGCTVDGVVGPQTRAAMAAAKTSPPPPPPAPPPPPPAPAPPPASSAPPPASSAPPWPGRLLSYPPGVHGDDVRRWQQQMANRGWHIAVDGDFGPASKAVALAFQREKGLSADGVVGPATWAAAWQAPVT
jgi:peptidoglycan hydrolase-like protein with peptidoglycan-binding domain